jgi:hypothetical protein
MADATKPSGVRKATLTRSAASNLRQRIDLVFLGDERRRLRASAIEILLSTREQLGALIPRLSKRQRDKTEEILEEAFSHAPVVSVEGEAKADLVQLSRDAPGSPRISVFEENVIVLHVKPRLGEPAIVFSQGLWRIVEDIKAKIYFDLPGEPLDPDGLVENDDPDGQPPERDKTEVDLAQRWGVIGIMDDD